MDVRRLRQFLTIVQHGSIGRAAAALNLSQPALTKGIGILEAELGVKLLLRRPRGVEPTVFGRVLAEHAKLITMELDHAADHITALRDGEEGSIVVGAVPSQVHGVLAQATARLLASRPGVRVALVVGSNPALCAGLKDGEIDIVVSALAAMPSDAHFEQEILFKDAVRIVARSSHPLADRRLISSDLAGWRWVLPHRGVMTRQRLEAFLADQGLHAPEVAVETDSPLFIRSILAATDCIAFAPDALFEPDLSDGRLTALDLEEATWSRTVGVSYRRNGFLSTVARSLIDEMTLLSHTAPSHEQGGR